MTLLHRLRSIALWILRRERAEQDLNDELQAFVDMAAADKVRAGVTPAEAHRLAMLELGGLEQVKERVRSGRHGGWIDTVGRDIRYGLRRVRRSPAFSGIAISTLALGIGGITAMFSTFDAVLIRPLPYADADRLVMIWDALAKTDITSKGNSTPAEWIEWRRLNTVFTDLAASQPGDATLSGDGDPEQVPARKVTWTFWSVLGTPPMLGRVFTEDEDNKGVRVVVISYGLWQRRYGGASDIVGRMISLNDEAYEVIGVMPRNFYFMPSREIDLWMPASFPQWMRTNFTWHDAQIVARLKPGVTLQQARASHDVVESAGDREGLPRPSFSDRHAIAGRDRRKDANRSGPAAERVGSAAADRVRQSDESSAVARRGAQPRSRGTRWRWGRGAAGWSASSSRKAWCWPR